MKLVGINPSEKSSSLVKSLTDFIKEDGKADVDLRCELASGIFRKLPSYLAQESDLRNLSTIVDQAVTAIKNFDSKKVSKTSFNIPGLIKSVGFMVVLPDCSFIVDTIREYFIEKNISLLCLTHPIFSTDSGENISLSFFQVEESPHANQNQILIDLNERLSSVLLATNSFGSMVEKLSLAINEVNESSDSLKEEIIGFLKWLKDGGFIFLGYSQNTKSKVLSTLGILNEDKNNITKDILKAVSENVNFINTDARLLFCSKTAIKSLIHRADYLDIISVKSNDGTIHNFVGLFTSKTRSQEASSVPILRKKLADVLIEEGLIPFSHDYKELISLADTLPKSDFLQYSKDQVKSYFKDVTDAHIQGNLKLIHIIDRLERFHYFTVALPKDRYSQHTVKTIESILRSAFSKSPNNLETHAVLGDHPLVLVRTMIPYDKNSLLTKSIEDLEEIILEKTISWDEKFLIHLNELFDEAQAASLYNFYSGAFSKAYQSSHSPIQALKDLKILEELNTDEPIKLDFTKRESYENSNLYTLRIFKRGEGLTLSNIVPYLGNCNFEVINELVYPVATEGAVWANIYDLVVLPKNETILTDDLILGVLIPALKNILGKNASNDILNGLLINPGLSLSQIAILRAYVRYLTQIKTTSSPRHAMEALVTNPDIALYLSEYFNTKFNPNGSRDSIPSAERFQSLQNISSKIQRSLKKVSNITHDRILATMLQVMDATLRTNCFKSEDQLNLSFKIESGKITSLPNPKPYREIFVSAPDFQGIHLRGGKIARGGLRWSSRPDDFRTEVLGLMKTQMVKNSIIVPVGAKGGFILHEEPTERKELLAKVETTYKKFIRCLLDITDNRIGESIKAPTNCICYDETDPYFVVAADRGTATFSDIANKIATEEYGFWLGDAFASGGSVGYDHKKLGITAKGAWECTKRHFNEIGIDIKNQEFTVVGVGDMSGDVFGNGLILSENAKLIAAFDHRHIFVDPTPNSKGSFLERLRMFNLPSSSWDDYDKKQLSPGGFVVSRSEKEVKLTDEAKAALGTEVDSCSTNELIKIILKAPVDLLWNGGIGTYIKSSEEDHSKAADRTNDDVRVDAIDLRTKIIAEGGNLGVTQLGRIEYCKIGGKINTDAIDNSGGVDMSDLEVNLKLLFRNAISSNQIKVEERDKALKACELNSCDKIISRNNAQSIALSVSAKRSRTYLGHYQDLINSYEKSGRLDRRLENLPSDEIFEKRKLAKAGLSRPELAILLAQTKMWAFEEILNSSLPDDPALRTYLTTYFPGTISKDFESLLDSHPLKREIIATQVANEYVERMGIAFTQIVTNQTGASYLEVFKSYLISESIFNAKKVFNELKVIDNANTSKVHIATLLRLQTTLENMTRWFIDNHDTKSNIIETISQYKDDFNNLINSTESILSATEKNNYDDALRELLVHGVPKEISKLLSASRYASIFLDIIRASKSSGRNILDLAKLYSTLATELSIGQLIEFAFSNQVENHWDNIALQTMGINIRTQVASLCDAIVIEQNGTSDDCINKYFSSRKELLEQYKNTLHTLRVSGYSVSTVYLLSNMLANLAK